MTLDINAGAIAAHKHGAALFRLVDQASIRGPAAALVLADSNSDAFPAELMFGISLLHEYRHYLDLGFTPFGFYRQNTAHEFYINFPALFFAGKAESIPIPLMSGMDPITRQALGISDSFVGSPLHRLGRTALSRMKVINDENGPSRDGRGLKIGGDRILEALAYLAQFEYLHQVHPSSKEDDNFSKFFADYNGSAFDLAYRWFIPYVHQIHPNEVLPNNRLMAAILFASLCGHIPAKTKLRRSSAEQPPLVGTDISPYVPSYRFAKLLDFFRCHPRPSYPDDDEAFHVVNKACKHLFSLNIQDEIELDIKHTNERISEFDIYMSELPEELRHLEVLSHLNGLNRQRESLLELFKKQTSIFTSSQDFYMRLSERLRPPFIYHFAQGMAAEFVDIPSDIRRKWIGLINRTYQKPLREEPNKAPTESVIYSFWSPIRGEDGCDKGLDDLIPEQQSDRLGDRYFNAKATLYSTYAPILRWLLYGNKYRTLLEVENENLMEAIGLDSVDVILDPMYEEADDISSPDLFMGFYSDRVCRCDVCGWEVNRDTGFLVSGRTIRQNVQMQEHYQTKHPRLFYTLFVKDWSDWMLCKTDMERFGFLKPKL
nr:hypothetical protein [uncultured Rhodopila sp.]